MVNQGYKKLYEHSGLGRNFFGGLIDLSKRLQIYLLSYFSINAISELIYNRFIDGLMAKPNGTDLYPLYSWMRNYKMMISWILNSIFKDMSAGLIFADCGLEMWLDLRDRFQLKNAPRII